MKIETIFASKKINKRINNNDFLKHAHMETYFIKNMMSQLYINKKKKSYSYHYKNTENYVM